jgi:hypothetical protein
MKLKHLDDDYVESGVDGSTYVAVNRPEGDCEGCAFSAEWCTARTDSENVRCVPRLRKDGQHVVFIRTQK